MSLSEEQLALRRTGVGGSEVGALLGVDPRSGPLDVYLAKKEGLVRESTPVMELGNFYEPATANLYAHRTGAKLKEVGTVAHPGIPFAICTPDRLASQTEGQWYDLSIKVPWFYLGQWGDPGTDEVPMPYLLQLQWETFILRARGELGESRQHHLAAPIDGDLRVYVIEEDVEIQQRMLDVVAKFWRDHVLKSEPPPLDGTATATDWLKRRFRESSGEMLEATADDEVLTLELREACTGFSEAERRLDLVKNRLRERIGTNAGLRTVAGAITWRPTKKGNRVLRHPFSREH